MLTRISFIIIWYYHLVNTPSLSDDCSDFLQRIERREVIGSTSTVSIAEATHKVMLADAVSTHGLDRKGLVARLKREPHLLAALSEHQAVITTVRALGIQVEVITTDLLETAAGLSRSVVSPYQWRADDRHNEQTRAD